MLSFDTETTGLDLWHGCLPYSMQICNDKGQYWYWSWSVDPLTRLPAINPQDLEDVADLLCGDEVVLHNAKYDLLAFDKACAYLNLPWRLEWQWGDIHDTLIKSHVLRNLWSHSLKDLRDVFFGVSRGRQDQLKLATDKARKICRSKAFIEQHGVWRIADIGDPHWPGVSRAPSEKEEDIEGWWLLDTWLPDAICEFAPEFLPPESEWYHSGEDWFLHPWQTVSQQYAMEDPLTTLVLNEVLDEALEAEGLTKISQQRHRLLEITYDMENIGLNIHGKKAACEIYRYRTEAKYQNLRVVDVANQALGMGANDVFKEDYNPASGPQTQRLLYDVWKLPKTHFTKPSKSHPGGQPAVNAAAFDSLKEILNHSPPAHLPDKTVSTILEWLDCFLSRKRNEKADDTLESYRNWSVKDASGLRIHPKCNITGTRFTRQSYNDPNVQNVGTGKEVFNEDGEKEIDFLLRDSFGPPPGKEWLSIDFQSIELLIWGFSCGSQVLKSTYNAGLPLFKPFMEAIHGFFDKEDKKYKKTKNGIYAKIYGAANNHADNTFGVKGAVKKIEDRIPEIKTFTKRLHNRVVDNGYIETLGGYRLYVESSAPHKATSAFVQGHAGWVIGLAMCGCFEYLREYPDIKMVLQVHDELIFEGPIGFHKIHADKLANLMQLAGEQFDIPTPTNKSLIANNWGEAIPL